MAQIRDFNLGRVTGQSENILQSRQQRKLSDILRPLQAQQAQQETDQGALKTNQLQVDAGIREAGILVGAFGQVDQDPQQNQLKWQNAIGQLQATGVDVSDLPEQFDPQSFQAIQGVAQSGGGGLTVGQRDFRASTKGFSPEEVAQAQRIGVGILPRAVSSAATTLAESGKTDIVARSQAEIERQKAESRAVGKATGEFKSAPLIAKAKAQIETAVNVARKEAAVKGETLTEVDGLKASLPGLLGVVDQLRELAPIATSTLSGRVFDVGLKEIGFGSTEGSTARAKFIAIINNQVLPLLKPTFGGSFTVQEGEALKATMGDPNATPAEKLAQLDAFIGGKVTEIQNKERLLSQPVTPSQELTAGAQQQAAPPAVNAQGWQLHTDAQGNQAYVGPNGEVQEI